MALRLGRVDAAIEVWERVPRVPPRPGGPRAGGATCTARSAPALSHKGERKARDRALPEGHQPAEGRAAAPRARAPVRGGRLALPAHGRQHARHLRVREGAAAGRAARRDARGQPRARDLRPRLRADRRHREGAREPRALGRAGARLGPRRDDPRAARARPPPRDLGGRHRAARGAAYTEALALAEQVGDLPAPGGAARRARAARGLPRRLGRRSRSPPRPAPSWPSARGWSASSACPYALRGAAALARAATATRAEQLFRRAARAGRAGGLVRARLRGAATAWRSRCATAAT